VVEPSGDEGGGGPSPPARRCGAAFIEGFVVEDGSVIIETELLTN